MIWRILLLRLRQCRERLCAGDAFRVKSAQRICMQVILPRHFRTQSIA